LFYLSVWIFGIAETGIACGSLPGTTTKVQRVGFPSAEIRFVSLGLALFHLVLYFKISEIYLNFGSMLILVG
jgi:hypothetical protein